MMGESQIIRGDLGARADDKGFDDAVETDDSDNGPVTCLLFKADF